MSADLLREAAALMRERAEDARAGRWITAPSDLTPEAALVLAEWEHGPRRVATCAGSLPEGNAANAEHIASWHPAVALAVADLLEAEAADLDSRQRSVDGLLSGIGAEGTVQIDAEHLAPAALTLARTYLGRDS